MCALEEFRLELYNYLSKKDTYSQLKQDKKEQRKRNRGGKRLKKYNSSGRREKMKRLTFSLFYLDVRLPKCSHDPAKHTRPIPAA